MAGKTIREQLKRRSGNGSKTAACVRCKGEIQPYAGRPVALLSGHYAHHPGQCADTAEREARVRQVAGQTSFAWECAHVEPGSCEADVCSVAGTERTAYAEHMRGHGATQLAPSVAPIRLRKSVPAARRQAPAVAPFKRIAWSTTEHFPTGEVHPAELGGGPVYAPVTTEHRGQFWANGPDAHSVIVIQDMRAAGMANRLVTLYLDSAGNLTADWSGARSSRRQASSRERDRKFWAEREAQSA